MNRKTFFPGPLGAALRIALSYLAISILWICFSDQAILFLFHDTGTLTTAQTYKGWFFVTASALFLFLLLGNEIKRYEKAAEALRAGEQYLGSILRAAPIGIGVVSNDRTLLTVNDRICSMCGYSRQELIGRNARMLYPDEAEHDLVGEEKYRQIRENGAGTVETRWQRKDGRIIDVLLSSTPINPHDPGSGVTFAALDITQRKRAETTLKESEQRFSKAFRSNPAPMVITDAESGLFLDVNQRWLEMIEFSREEVIGRTSREIDIWQDPEERDRMVLELATRGAVRDYPVTLKTKSGKTLFTLSSVEKITINGQDALLSLIHDYTERQTAARTLRESEEKFVLAFEASPDAVNINRLADGLYVEINQGFTALTGYTREDVHGKTSLELDIWHDPADRQRLLESLEEKGYCENLEAQFRRKDGSLTTALMSARTISLNKVPHILSITRDIGELKRMEQENLDRKRLFETMFNAIADTIVITDSQGRVQLANKAMETMFGYQTEELYGKTTEVLYLDHDAYIQTGRTVYGDEAIPATHLYITAYRDKSGRIFPGETFGTRLFDSNNQWIGNLGIIRDITQRSRDEADLKRLQVAIEHAGEVIVITDAAGNIQYANPAFEKTTGYTFEEALHRNPRILKSGEHDEAFYTELWNTISSGRTWTGNLINRKKDGTLYTEEATISPVFNTRSQIINYVALKRDITAQLKLEAQYQQAQKMESVGRLTGGVAHDFNNILAIILGYTEMALQLAEPSQKLHSYLERIFEAANRSADIVRQLLAFSRKQTIAPKVLDLNRTVAGMLAMLQRLIGEDIDLAWLPSPDLSPIKMDPAQIDQILVNLCVNARDAIAGIGKITIETSTARLDAADCAQNTDARAGEYAVLAVSDSGCGMKQEVIDKIFEPFFTTKDLLGTGLGLSTVYGIVKQNNGFINVYSEPGKGTTFKIHLPLHKDATVWKDEENPGPLAMSRGETVLLVEDDPIILELGFAMLEKLGYRVLTANTPDEALQRAGQVSGTIDLLITDVIMPGMNGKELAQQLLRLYPALKLIYISGYTADVIAHHGVLDPGVQFLQKPFSIRDLSGKIRDVLDETIKN